MPISTTAPAIDKPAAEIAREQAVADAAAELERIEQAVLFDGEPHTVRRRDGTTEAVRVRLAAVRELPRWLACQDDEPAMLELICDRPPGWADGLHPADHFRLVDRARALNFPAALLWQRSQLAMQRRVLASLDGGADAKP